MWKMLSGQNGKVRSPRLLARCVSVFQNKEHILQKKLSQTWMVARKGIDRPGNGMESVPILAPGVRVYQNFAPLEHEENVQVDLPLKRICGYKVPSQDEKRDDGLLMRALSAYGNNIGNEKSQQNHEHCEACNSEGASENKIRRTDAAQKEMIKTDTNSDESISMEAKTSCPIEEDPKGKFDSILKIILDNKISFHDKKPNERFNFVLGRKAGGKWRRRHRKPNKGILLQPSSDYRGGMRNIVEKSNEGFYGVSRRFHPFKNKPNERHIQSHPRGVQAPFPSFAECVQNGLKNGRPIKCDCSNVPMQWIVFRYDGKRKTYDLPAVGHYWKVKKPIP